MNTPDDIDGNLCPTAIEAWELRHLDAARSRELAAMVQLDSDATRTPRSWAWAEVTRTWHLGSSGQVDGIKASLSVPIGIFTVHDDQRGLAAAWLQLARCVFVARDCVRAEELIAAIGRLQVKLPPAELVDLQSMAANCAFKQGRREAAIQHIASAFENVAATATLLKLRMLYNLAGMCAELGDADAAVGAFTLALNMATRHHPADVLNIQIGAMQAYAMFGAIGDAHRVARTIMPQFRKLAGSQPDLGRRLGYAMALVFARAGQPKHARECVAIALDAVPETPDRDHSQLNTIRAWIARADGDHATARLIASRTLADATDIRQVIAARQCIEILIECAVRENDLAAVAELSRRRTEVPAKTSLVARALISHLRQLFEATIHGETLSDRERACLVLAAKGQTSRDIADKLGINQRTVDFHFANIVRKLNVINRQEAIAKAAKAQLLH